jgi:inner membrane protein
MNYRKETEVNEYAMLPSGSQFRIDSRSMGVKLIVVCGLAFSMTIPAFFVEGLVNDRTTRAADVVRQISAISGGQQTFLGPTLAIPYKTPPQSAANAPKRGIYLVFPAVASAALKTVTEERRRSLFKVPVFQADVKLDAAFDLAGVPAAAPPGAELDWDRAELVVGVSDARGALADAMLTADGKTATLVPAQIAPDIAIGGDQSGHIKLTLLGTRIAAKPDARFNVTSSLRFSGAQRIAVLSYGKTSHLSAQGDWPSPGFDGGFLPTRRTIARNGFSAEWSVPFIARGVRAEGPGDSLAGLEATGLGTSFIEVADPYQSVSRSLKYVLLFLGLIFLSYFVFEVATGKRVHPAQYILVGIAQIIFYLLLLSLAERIGFDWGFLLAGVATVALLSTNAGWVFSSRVQGGRALATFALLYAVIYLLLRAEDNALLVGAIASFLAVTATMYLTRRIDWYSPLAVSDTRAQPITPPLP